MTDTEFPTARVIWKARAIGQDINDPGGIPEEIPLDGIKVDLIPSPKVIECVNGAGDPVTYRIKEWHLVTANNGELINYEDPTNGIEIVASDAFPGYVVSWKSIIEDPSGTLPPIIKKWLAPAGSIVDLTTVVSVPNDPNPIADYLQAVYDAREARDNAIAARIAAETARTGAENALAAVPGAVTEQVTTQVAPQVAAATTAKNDAVEAKVDAETARDKAIQAAADAIGALPEFDAAAGEYDPEGLAAWMLRKRDGQIYGVQIPKGLATACTKIAANAGIANPTPGVIGTPAIDPYRTIAPFFTAEVNGYVTPDGVPHVTAFAGDATFSRTGSNGDVWILAPNLFWRFSDDGADSVTISISDVSRPGFEVQPKGKLPTGARRPYMLYAKYALSIVDGTARSISGQPPASRNISHNSLITQCKNATTGYSGKSYADDWYTKVMFLLKYASKNSQSIFPGCTWYSKYYAPAVAESNVTRVLITTVQADNFQVGSAVMLGSNVPTSTDRQVAQLFDVILTAKIVSKEVVGSNTALNLNLAAPITTATTQLLSTAPWWTGGCDAVVGDGSPTSNTSGREPFVIQGIEMAIGLNEILGDAIVVNDGITGWRPSVVKDSRNATTGAPNANYQTATAALPTDSTSSGKYPLYPTAGPGGILYAIESGASQSTGMCDQTYTSSLAITGSRTWLSLGSLTGYGDAGIWCLNPWSTLSLVRWDFGSRLSANGRAS